MRASTLPLHRRPAQSLDNRLQESAYQGGDFLSMRFQSKMPGLEKVYLSIRQIFLVSDSACGYERGVMAPPCCKQWRAGVTKVRLESRIERDVASVVKN